MQFLRTRRHAARYKWWVLSCTSLGVLLATINSGTLIIALPDLERSLHTSISMLRPAHVREQPAKTTLLEEAA